MRKLSKTEKTIIGMTDNGYNGYQCNIHGVFMQRKDVANGECAYCKKVCSEIPNIDELRAEYKKELGS